ncbi:hypothetical protein [Streptomyces sp. NPDC053560]|uniref:hypothetical protein n=1 Tax=Streptomyces sp. NPDC053560 TaxID=3365711 RepID=UPI0037CCDC06
MTHPRTTHPNHRPWTGPARIGALYDLAVAPVFATPWTARLAIEGLRSVHTALGLPGPPPDHFGPEHLLFVTFFGVLVTMWAVVRLVRGDAVTTAADTAGRMAFALLMAVAMVNGASTVLTVFLAVETGFLLAQGRQLIRAKQRHTRTPRFRETVSR